MSAQDLELASTDDLIKELLGRFDAAVFTGTKLMSERDKVRVRCFGRETSCLASVWPTLQSKSCFRNTNL